MIEKTVHILDEHTANKIAAGEVVERPASIVKELIENSLDAGSTDIEVEIADGGTKLIRVTDNGSGMSRENAELAILRHATSKIRSADDLHSLTSLGFRGEALPSIAAVSKFTLTTRPQEAAIGTRLELIGGKIDDVIDAGTAPGTTIVVRDLFFNTPARRKFLKTVATESSQIHHMVSKIALSYPEVTFKLINQGRLVLSTPGNGNINEAAASLYGHKILPELLPLNFDYEGIKVEGIVAKPNLIKGSRSWQTLIVNRRVIQNRMMSKALDNAYHSLLPKTGYPLAVLALTIPPSTVDVNVHPQKNEIKFSNDQIIYQAVYRAVKSVLLDHSTLAEIAASAPEPQQPRSTPIYLPLEATSNMTAGKETTLRDAAAFPITERQSTTTANYPRSFEPPAGFTPTAFSVAEAREALEQQDDPFLPAEDFEPVSKQTNDHPELYPLGQIDHCFIVAQGQDSLYIIDQHAAHERILYDRFSAATERIPSQQLLVPLLLEFTEPEADLILDYQGLFYELGFAVEAAGPATIRLLETPADIPTESAETYVRDILLLLSDEQRPTPQELRHSCLQLAACHGAIRAGKDLNMRQMQALVADLCKTELPYTCPHGRPSMIRFRPHDLERFFKRT